MTNPLVSIIVCTYNRAKLLPQTLESIFRQNYKPVEIIVIDDGSTDGTSELIQKYDSDVRYYRQPNQGIAVARNTGLKISRGEYIAFQDDDDLMTPQRIALLFKTLQEHPNSVLATGDCDYIDENGRPSSGGSHFLINSAYQKDIAKPVVFQDGYSAVLWPKITAHPCATLFRKKDAERIGGFDERFTHACEDTDFFARLGALGPLVYVPEVVFHYRKGHPSLWGKELSGNYDRILMFEKHINAVGTKNEKLCGRLKYRLLQTFKKIALLQNSAQFGTQQDNRLKEAFSLLNIRDQFEFGCYKFIGIPLRRMIKGSC